MDSFPLAVQTSYAELVDQLRAALVGGLAQGSTFRLRKIKGRSYWYAQEPSGPLGQPPERYIGPDTEPIRVAVESGRRAHADSKGRRIIVRSLVAAGLSIPDQLSGRVIERFAQEGFFRLRGVLIGTAAYQTFSGLLGVRLPSASLITGDLDVAQDYGVAIALNDRIGRPLIDILREIDPSFQASPTIDKKQASVSYAGPNGFRVDVLTTKLRDTDDVLELPPLKTSGRALPFMDYLLRDTADAAVLVGDGVLVRVPLPVRFAIHKLIISSRRRVDLAKARKDIAQAESLLSHMAVRDPVGLSEAWTEAQARGTTWQNCLDRGLAALSVSAAEAVKAALK